MRQIDIEQRRKKILCAIVDYYIETAFPVGSRVISQRFRWSISPATIRNVMADLEEMGMITHPHTSSGRVPTDKGYRFFVDCLLEPKRLTKEEEDIITVMLSRKCEDFESLMQNASRAISMITNIVGIVLTPRLKRSVFKHIEFIPLTSSRVLAVIITGAGIVKNSMLEMEEQLARTELVRISEFLNQELEGMFLGEINNHLMRKLLEQRDSFYTFLKRSILLLSMPSLLNMEERVYFDGTTGLMEQPEFKDTSKVKLFLKLFEEKTDILNLFNEDIGKDGIKIHIGKENFCKDIQDCTVVTSNYKVKDRVLGVIGAIGPTRMEYGKVISTVTYLSEAIGKVLEDIG